MNKLFIVLALGVIFGLSGCAAQKSDTSYYERANKVSKEALSELDRD